MEASFMCSFVLVIVLSLVPRSVEQNVVLNQQQPTLGNNHKVVFPKYDFSVRRRYSTFKRTNLLRVPISDNSIEQAATTQSSTTTSEAVVPTPTVDINDETCDCQTVKKEIEFLQEESKNLNFRVSQLYIQLLQEVVEKKDESLKYTKLQSELLNETVRHYQLREMHYELREMVQNMGDTLVEQRQLIRELQSQPRIQSPAVAKSPIRRNRPHIIERPLQLISETSTNHKPAAAPKVPRILGGPYEDCVDAQSHGHNTSGIYIIQLPDSDENPEAWCDFDKDPGGWLLIQRRVNGTTNFFRNMANYKKGFGDLNLDFWLGLEYIHQITNREGVNYKLRIDMVDWDDKDTSVEYNSFRVTGEDDGYRLKVQHYEGNAGDSLAWHNNMKFTTKNVDNDPFNKNCANYQRGGWWYNTCAHSNLNGIYYRTGHYKSRFQDGIYWSAWRGGAYSLKKVEMKIRPTE